MQWIKRVLSTVGGLVVVALLLAIVAPKSVHALVATLVQVVPGSTTHVGQNESNLVALVCYTSFSCSEENPSSGNKCCVGAGTAYIVPAGYTFVVTDYSWILNGQTPGNYICDNLSSPYGDAGIYPHPSSKTCAVADQTGFAASSSHFTTGLRFGSGSSPQDERVINGYTQGTATVQGYLVPN